jgi:hypothetical protein
MTSTTDPFTRSGLTLPSPTSGGAEGLVEVVYHRLVHSQLVRKVLRVPALGVGVDLDGMRRQVPKTDTAPAPAAGLASKPTGPPSARIPAWRRSHN